MFNIIKSIFYKISLLFYKKNIKLRSIETIFFEKIINDKHFFNF